MERELLIRRLRQENASRTKDVNRLFLTCVP